MADIAKAICALAAKIKGAAVEETDNIAEAVDLCTENYSGGGGAGVLVVNRDSQDTLDKTWQEIADADVAFVVYTDGNGNHRREFVSELYVLGGSYYVGTVLFIPGELENITANEYSVDSPDGYPVYD